MIEQIGKYKVTELLGHGGMADVYVVDNEGVSGFSRKLCIKKIRRELVDRPELVKLFETEARIVGNLRHDNIIQVYDFGRDEKTRELFLVMEYVDGLDLNQILHLASEHGLQVPLDFAVYVIESLLLALDHAHTLTIGREICPVIHRDISPHNLLVSTSGVVKLADFGIAKAKGMSEATYTGELRGKLSYMSPEQAAAGKVEITPVSDLFSAGLVFWECVTCERLFQATMAHQVLMKVLTFDKASLPHYSHAVNDYLSKLLAPAPEDRFESATAALRALRRIGIQPCSARDAADMVRRLKRLKENEEIADAVRAEAVEADEATSLGVLTGAERPQGRVGLKTGTNFLTEVSDNSIPTDVGSPILGDGPRKPPQWAWVAGVGIVAALLLVGICLMTRDNTEQAMSEQTTSETVETVESRPKRSASEVEQKQVSPARGVTLPDPKMVERGERDNKQAAASPPRMPADESSTNDPVTKSQTPSPSPADVKKITEKEQEKSKNKRPHRRTKNQVGDGENDGEGDDLELLIKKRNRIPLEPIPTKEE